MPELCSSPPNNHIPLASASFRIKNIVNIYIQYIFMYIIPLKISTLITALVTAKWSDVLCSYTTFAFAEDELTKSTVIKSPTKSRNRNGSTTEMAVDQLQASEKLIAGEREYLRPLYQTLSLKYQSLNGHNPSQSSTRPGRRNLSAPRRFACSERRSSPKWVWLSRKME